MCEGTGRAADLLAYIHKQTEEGGNLPDAAEPDIISTIKKTFNFGQSEAVHLFQTMMECMKKRAYHCFSHWIRGSSRYRCGHTHCTAERY